MKQKIQEQLFTIAQYFEIIIAVIVFIAVIISTIGIIGTLPQFALNCSQPGTFSIFLKAVFDVVIGIEFLKMLCRHSLDSVVEVLLFAVARTLIVEHMSIQDTLIGILAIAILFLVRKYLFVPILDKPLLKAFEKLKKDKDQDKKLL